MRNAWFLCSSLLFSALLKCLQQCTFSNPFGLGWLFNSAFNIALDDGMTDQWWIGRKQSWPDWDTIPAFRYCRVLTMVYNTLRYWVFGLRPSSGFFPK
jgi:hypothetical protein